MWKVLANAVEMLIYAAVYIILALIAVKVIGATFTTDFEKKISEENNFALALICASLFTGLAILLSAIVQ
ncbi:MAG: hypothetical protein A4E61_00907 [Syntrophorhabdus sp. PtaB.Bin184]|jgi:uncharacterized membrane protein YjfL (UPF0719 family)|nr:MAG: hypothetical protein A4E61_00907 [Syntrophorhabdus sp. PtaB.Bin184]